MNGRTEVCAVCERDVPLNDIDHGVCTPCRILAGAVDEWGGIDDEVQP